MAGMLTRLRGKPVRAYSIGFEAEGYDERLPYPGTGEAEWRGLLDRRGGLLARHGVHGIRRGERAPGAGVVT